MTVLFKTSMAVGGVIALMLDNLIPGTPEERGLLVWRNQAESDDGKGVDTSTSLASVHVYDLPFGLNRLSKHKIAKFLPFLPYYPSKEAEKKNDFCLGERNGALAHEEEMH